MRAVAVPFIRGYVTRGPVVVRVSRAVVVSMRLNRIAGIRVAGSVLMMPKRHALRGNHGGHTLYGHDQRNYQCEKTNEAQAHLRKILYHEVYDTHFRRLFNGIAGRGRNGPPRARDHDR